MLGKSLYNLETSHFSPWFFYLLVGNNFIFNSHSLNSHPSTAGASGPSRCDARILGINWLKVTSWQNTLKAHSPALVCITWSHLKCLSYSHSSIKNQSQMVTKNKETRFKSKFERSEILGTETLRINLIWISREVYDPRWLTPKWRGQSNTK